LHIRVTVSIVMIGIALIIILLGIYFISNNKEVNTSQFSPATTEDAFSIASWNLQTFGPAKASNDTLLRYYAEKLGAYDLFVVEEIRDESGMAIGALAERLPTYQYIISERAGQSASKEQYAIFYDNKSVLLNWTDWTQQEQNNFERPPLEATFRVNNWAFTIYAMHVKPSNVPQELSNLEHLVGTPTRDTIILGDLNADGDYYFNGVIHNFLGWHWLTTSDMDTTVAASINAYDRIIINNSTENNIISVGIMSDVQSSQSDHYLVFAVFNPEEQ
jgi:deoxyribonuclease-1-like protein